MKNSSKGVLGFDNLIEFIDYVLGVKNHILNLYFLFICALTSFITHYIWDSSLAVYTLLSLMIGDWFLGVYLAVRASNILRNIDKNQKHKEINIEQLKNRKFSSRRFPKIFIAVPLSLYVLSISWNLAKSSSFYLFLPPIIYGGLTGTYLISLIENCAELGILPKNIVFIIYEKLNPVNWVNKNTKK